MRKFLRIFSIVLLVCWMGFIFYLSSQNAEESSAVSGGFIQTMAEKFYPEFNEMPPEKQQEEVASFQFIVRKCAHFAAFGLLGLLSFLTFISYTSLKFKTRTFLCVFVSAVYAVSDEVHQYFVPGRSCELRDFLIDFGGIISSVLLCVLFVMIIKPLRRKSAYKGEKRNKKQLINLTETLYEKLDDSYGLQKQMEIEISLYKQRIENLEEQLEEMKIPEKETIPTESENEVVEVKEIELPSDVQLGASFIGKTVMEVTMLCNELTSKNTHNSKELVNLALGRTEVLKAEILKIVALDLTIEEKRALMQKEQESAYDYFDSLKAQIS